MHSVLCAAQDIKIFFNLQKAEYEENCEICSMECCRLLYTFLDVLERVHLEFVGFTEVCCLVFFGCFFSKEVDFISNCNIPTIVYIFICMILHI